MKDVPRKRKLLVCGPKVLCVTGRRGGRTAASSEVGRLLWSSLTQGGRLSIARGSLRLFGGFWSGGEKSGARWVPLVLLVVCWVLAHWVPREMGSWGCGGVSGEEGRLSR